jgi:hypothetical protein
MATTIATIVTESLRLSGIRTPTHIQITRATDEWYTEVLDDIRSRKQWKKTVNVLKDWRFALTKGVLVKALKDRHDLRRESISDIREAEIDYENAIKILIRKDNREAIKRQFTKKEGGMPLTR